MNYGQLAPCSELRSRKAGRSFLVRASARRLGESTSFCFLSRAEVELIDRLVRHDRTAVSSAVLAVAGIGAGEATRRAVLA